MGWDNYHLHTFTHKNQCIGVPDEDYADITDEQNVFVYEVFPKKGSKLKYQYDFGDCWDHIITCQGKTTASTEYVEILNGKRACPPEDCGGVPGYNQMLKAISDPTDPMYEELTNWLDDDFDPEKYDIDEANAILYETMNSIMPVDFDSYDEYLFDDLDDELQYNAMENPDPQEWLTYDEGERIMSIQGYHNSIKDLAPNAIMHASMHCIVENQLAENLFSTHRALKRLMNEGLNRHEAIHAISTVVAEQMQNIMSIGKPVDQKAADAQYNKNLKKLTAQAWRDM
jgi:hypothetical protein